MRHDAFDARNYFDSKDAAVPPLRQHQFGGVLGGPIARDRSFYFLSYEGQRVRRSLTQTFSVPTAGARRGDFSAFAPLCDPLAATAGTGSCTPFPQNQIPADRIDPLSAAFLQRVPLPTSVAALQNLTSAERQVKDVDQISVRVDHRLTDADQMFARVSTFDADEIQPFGTGRLQETLVPGFGRSVGTRARNVAASYTRAFGTGLLNEVRFGWMSVRGGRSASIVGPTSPGRSVSRA